MTKSYSSIQALRALAATMVVFFHAGGLAGLFPPESPDGAPHWLASGVDIFFVISGFVMVASTDRRATSAGQFLKARFIRIVPPYWIATLLFICLVYVTGGALPSMREVILSLLFVFHDNAITGPMPVLGVGWSLNYEVYFYLLFAGLLFMPTLRRIGVLFVLFAGAVVLRRYAEGGFEIRMTSPLVFEFLAGMMLGHFRRYAIYFPSELGLVGIVVCFVALATLHLHLPRTALYGSLATGLVGSAVIAESYFTRHLRFALPVGDSSYVLYLSHILIIMVLTDIMGLTVSGALQAIALTFICVSASIPLHFYGERRLTAAIKRWMYPSKEGG